MLTSRRLKSRVCGFLLIGGALAWSTHTARAQTDAWWTNPDGGAWVEGANWSTDPDYPNNGPSETYNATIDLAGNPYTVGLDTDITIDNFTLDSAAATLNHLTGTFSVLGTANLLSGTYYLDDGVLAGGTWNVAPGTVDVSTYSYGLLDGITLNGDIDLARNSARLRIANGLALNGTITLSGEYTRLTFEGTQTVSGGTIHVEGSSHTNGWLYVTEGSTLTLDPGVVVSGNGGWIREAGTLVNQGLISGRYTIAPGLFVNEGTVEAHTEAGMQIGWDGIDEYEWTNTATGIITATDSTLDLGGQWSNAGLIEAVNSTVNLGGSFTTSGLGTFERVGGTVNLTGELDNTGSALDFNVDTGSWWLDGGTITGGELNFADGERLRFDLGVLDGVTVNGTLDFSDEQATVVLRNGTTFQGDVTLGNGDQLIFEDWPSLDDKTITMERGGLVFERAQTTLGAQLHISGPAGYVDGREGNVLTNLGTITAVGDSSYQLRVGGASFINENLVEASDGGMLALYAEEWTNAAGGLIRATDAEVLVKRSTLPMTFMNHGTIDSTRSELSLEATWSNYGTINAMDSTVNLGGNFSTADIGTINRTGGTVNLTGYLDNTDDVLLLDATTGSWNLAGGSITGGTVQFADGQRLDLTDNTHSLLDAVTLEGGLDFSTFEAVVTLANGTTFEGNVDLTGAGSRLILRTGQTFDDKTVTFATPDRYIEGFQPEGADTLTLGPNVLVHGGGGEIRPFTHGPHDSPHVINQGVVSADMAGESIDVKFGVFGMTIDNQGTFEARNGGTLRISHAQIMANYADNTLTGGDWAIYADSTLDFGYSSPATITTNAANIVLSGDGSVFVAIDPLELNLGRFAIDDGRDFGTLGDLLNEGELFIGVGSTLSVNGDFSESLDALLGIELGGLIPGDEFGLITVSGTASLAGTLAVSLDGDFLPPIGSEFEFLAATSLTGAFDDFNFPDLPGGRYFEIGYTPTAATLSVVPEPTSLLLLAFAAITSLRRR